MGTLFFVAALAFAQDDPAPEPAPAAPAPTSNVPQIDELEGTWWMTSTLDGKEAVGWPCTGHPTTFEFDRETVMITLGGEPLGGAVRNVTTRGAALVLTTTLEACTGSKEMTLEWADPAHHVLKVTRCEGTPRTVRVVRDLAAGIPVMRQCCALGTGKAVKYVGIDDACPAGADGQKPTPLKR